MVFYGQVIIGPPGSGKTTFCQGMQMFLSEIERNCDIINVDFANDNLPYKPSIDVRDLISLQEIMEKYELGPNGGLVYCMEYLLENLDWLEKQIESLDSNYIIFDFPGQIELYTHHKSVQDILETLIKKYDMRLCSIGLVDSYYCSQPATFISAVLVTLCTMLRMALPHVNILSKIDMLSLYGPLPFNLDFFTEMLNIKPLLRYLSTNNIPTDEFNDNKVIPPSETETDEPLETGGQSLVLQKFHKLSEAICDVVDDFGLVSFHPVNIEDAQTVGMALAEIDRANGYSMLEFELENMRQMNQHGEDGAKNSRKIFNIASKHLDSTFSRALEIQEKYQIHTKEEKDSKIN